MLKSALLLALAGLASATVVERPVPYGCVRPPCLAGHHAPPRPGSDGGGLCLVASLNPRAPRPSRPPARSPPSLAPRSLSDSRSCDASRRCHHRCVAHAGHGFRPTNGSHAAFTYAPLCVPRARRARLARRR